MKWIDFQVIADEQGLRDSDEIDTIEKNGNRYDICYTTKDGYEGVVTVED